MRWLSNDSFDFKLILCGDICYICISLHSFLQQQEHFYDVLPGMDLSPTNPVTLKPQTARSSLQVCNILFF